MREEEALEKLAALERRFENVACARCDFSQDVPCVCPDYHTRRCRHPEDMQGWAEDALYPEDA